MIPIAVVGIDCRFPGARDKDAFWRLLMDGVVTDAEVPSQRWDIDTYYHPDGAAGSMNTRRAHFIDDVDAFDNEFSASRRSRRPRWIRSSDCSCRQRGAPLKMPESIPARWPARRPGSLSG